jgi:hypothetical protein
MLRNGMAGGAPARNAVHRGCRNGCWYLLGADPMIPACAALGWPEAILILGFATMAVVCAVLAEWLDPK